MHILLENIVNSFNRVQINFIGDLKAYQGKERQRSYIQNLVYVRCLSVILFKRVSAPWANKGVRILRSRKVA